MPALLAAHGRDPTSFPFAGFPMGRSRPAESEQVRYILVATPLLTWTAIQGRPILTLYFLFDISRQIEQNCF